MQSEEASVALLGKTDAAFLGGGGRLLLRLDGREPVELYGYQVAAEHLERLVKVMRSAYPAAYVERSAGAPPPHPPIDEPPDLDDSGGPTAAPPIEPSPSGAAPSLEPLPVLAPRPEVPPPPAPIQIRCFGSPRVLCMGQVVWPRGGGDAKPWELLLFLACQPADGASREAVVQAIWPDTERAEGLPHRFRQLRYRLRRQLQDVPDAPEDDGIHLNRRGLCLDPDIIYSDACEFLRLVRTARLCTNSADMIEPFEQARALYIGDLLDGADTRRYAWVDERDDSGVTLREHFRRTFQNASLRLAEAYAECDQLESATALYRELSELDPADERLWVALLHLHHRRRDIAGLEAEWLRMQRAFRELAEELDITDGQCADEASRETVDEYQRLRASLRDLELAAV